MKTDMSDDTVQHELEAVIRPDGSGEIRDGGATEPVAGDDADALRAQIMQRVMGVAAAREETVRLRLADVDGRYRLLVHPDGGIGVEGEVEPLGSSDDDHADEPGADEGGAEELGDDEAGADEAGASEAGGSETEADEDDADLDDDDGGFHDEGLDDDFDDLDDLDDPDDEPIDGDFEVPFDNDEPIDGDFEVPVSAGQARAEAAPPRGSAPEPRDGGYADLFGLGPDEVDDDAAEVHETIQLPRPGMMRDEPPAVTGMHPIIPPAGADESDADERGANQGDADLGDTDQGDADLGDTYQGDADQDGANHGDADQDGEPALDLHDGAAQTTDTALPAGAALPVRPAQPAAPANAAGREPVGGDAYGSGARVAPDWSPSFPRGGEPAAPRSARGVSSTPTGWLAPARADDAAPGAGHEAEHPVPAEAPQWPRRGAEAGPLPGDPRGDAAHTQAVPVHPDPTQSVPARPTPGAGPTLDDFLADRGPSKTAPAARGWRAGLRRTTGGLVRLGPGARERAERDEIAAIQRVFDGPKTIVVVNPKGGAHKTTTTLMVAAMFGMHRGGYTLAWDNNETRGTLGWRSHRADHERTAVDLLRRLPHFEISGGATIADIDRFVRNQGEAMFDVLASDDDAASAAIIDDDAFSRLHRTLSRFYRMLVIDTGNNMRASNWEAALDVADQLVIVSTAREDTAASAAWLADGLRERGHEEMLANAVTVLSSPSAKEDPRLTARLHDHFAQLTREVVEVPYDEAFVGGGELDVALLRPETRDAWRRVAAVIARGL